MWKRTGYLAALGVGVVAGAALAQNEALPKIRHEPVKVAVKGQPISILARVTPGSARIKSVTLHHTTSRDAAPLKQEMTSSGGGIYAGSIPAHHFTTAPRLSYYIEAVDENDEWAETRWHEVQVQTSRPEKVPVVIDHTPERTAVTRVEAGRNDADTRVPAGRRPVREDRQGISTTTMIIGGVLAAGAGVAIAAGVGGGGGGGDNGGGGEPMDAGDTGGGDADPAADSCTDAEAVGTWVGITDPARAPGFALFVDNSAQFLIELGGLPAVGSWILVGCDLTLFPPGTNEVYRGTGSLSDDRLSVTINGFTYRRGG